MIESTYDKDRFIKLLKDGLNHSSSQVKELLGNFSEEQLNWKPSAKSWSILEVLAHLNQTSLSYKPGLTDATENANMRHEEKVKIGFIGKMLAQGSAPNKGSKKMKSPKAFLPDLSNLSKDQLMEAWSSHQNFLLSVVKQMPEINLTKSKLNSPASNIIKINLAAAMLTLMVHQQRHLEQMARVITSPAFPRS